MFEIYIQLHKARIIHDFNALYRVKCNKINRHFHILCRVTVT